MLIVLLIVFILLGVLGLYLCNETNLDESIGGFISIVGFCGVTITVIMFIVLLSEFPYNVDKIITMYEDENTKIETKIRETVRAYMEYEESTYEKLVADADLTTLVIKYPELNSNELVKAEIATYKKNNDKLKELKEEQINKSIMAWWLYFGE